MRPVTRKEFFDYIRVHSLTGPVDYLGDGNVEFEDYFFEDELVAYIMHKQGEATYTILDEDE